MRGVIANTDFDWFTPLRAIEPPVGEVNFWKPESNVRLAGLRPGEPVIFKLSARDVPHWMAPDFNSPLGDIGESSE